MLEYTTEAVWFKPCKEHDKENDNTNSRRSNRQPSTSSTDVESEAPREARRTEGRTAPRRLPTEREITDATERLQEFLEDPEIYTAKLIRVTAELYGLTDEEASEEVYYGEMVQVVEGFQFIENLLMMTSLAGLQTVLDWTDLHPDKSIVQAGRPLIVAVINKRTVGD